MAVASDIARRHCLTANALGELLVPDFKVLFTSAAYAIGRRAEGPVSP